MKKLSHKIAASLLVLIFALVVGAQSVGPKPDATTGKLTGLILDSGNARIPKAKIIVERAGYKNQTVSDANGHYEIDLPA